MVLKILDFKKTFFSKIISTFVLASFLSMQIGVNYGYAAGLPASVLAGSSVVQTGLVQKVSPPLLKGLHYYPHDPFKFTFMFDQGDTALSSELLNEESAKLIRYFLASLTIPEEELWVNLSPYEKDMIISDDLSLTDMGEGLLSQDYLLKQVSASLTNPESPLGKKFWKTVYERTGQLMGKKNRLPMNTFNKVWIMPDTVVLRQEADKIFIKEARLKVMMEADYVAMQKNVTPGKPVLPVSQFNASLTGKQAKSSNGLTPVTSQNNITTQIMKEVILPVIEEEVNNGKSFIELRQIYHSLILAAWFKARLRAQLDSFGPPKSMDQNANPLAAYINNRKIKGIDTAAPESKEHIYQQYLSAYAKGAYNIIRKEYDAATKRQVRRKYFSGGAMFGLRFDPDISRASIMTTAGSQPVRLRFDNTSDVVFSHDIAILLRLAAGEGAVHANSPLEDGNNVSSGIKRNPADYQNFTPDVHRKILAYNHLQEVAEVMTFIGDWIGDENRTNNPRGQDVEPLNWKLPTMPKDCTLTDLIKAAKGEESTEKAKETIERIRYVNKISADVRAKPGRRHGTGGFIQSYRSGDAHDYTVGDLHSLELMIELSKLLGWNLLYSAPTFMSDYGNSPYGSLNNLRDAIAIDIDKLTSVYSAEQIGQYIKTEQEKLETNYDALTQNVRVREFKDTVLRRVYAANKNKILHDSDFIAYKTGNKDLLGQILHLIFYKRFMNDPAQHNGWWFGQWPQEYRDGDTKTMSREIEQNADEIEYQYFTQWVFSQHWQALARKAHDVSDGSKSINLLGDVQYQPSDADMWVEHCKEVQARKATPDAFIADEEYCDWDVGYDTSGGAKKFIDSLQLKVNKRDIKVKNPLIMNPDGSRPSICGVPADMFGPPQVWGGATYNMAGNFEAVIAFFEKKLKREYDLNDEARFDHGLGMFRNGQYSQDPAGKHAWENLRIKRPVKKGKFFDGVIRTDENGKEYEEISVWKFMIREFPKNGSNKKKRAAARRIYAAIKESIRQSSEFGVQGSNFFNPGTNELAPNNMLIVSKDSTEKNALERWLVLEGNDISRLTDNEALIETWLGLNDDHYDGLMVDMINTVLMDYQTIAPLADDVFNNGKPSREWFSKKLNERKSMRAEAQKGLINLINRLPQEDQKMYQNIFTDAGMPNKYNAHLMFELEERANSSYRRLLIERWRKMGEDLARNQAEYTELTRQVTEVLRAMIAEHNTDHPDWKERFKDIFDARGLADIKETTLMFALGEQYVRARADFRWQMIEFWNADNSRYRENKLIEVQDDGSKDSDPGKERERQAKKENAVIDSLLEYLEDPLHPPRPSDRLMIFGFAYGNGEKILERLLALAQSQGKILSGEFLGTPTSEIERVLELPKFDQILKFRVFVFGFGHDNPANPGYKNAGNINAEIRFTESTHLTSNVLDWQPLKAWWEGRDNKDPDRISESAREEIINHVFSVVENKARAMKMAASAVAIKEVTESSSPGKQLGGIDLNPAAIKTQTITNSAQKNVYAAMQEQVQTSSAITFDAEKFAGFTFDIETITPLHSEKHFAAEISSAPCIPKAGNIR